MRRSRWPNASREELVERCRAWAARNEARVVVVFDGGEPTERRVDDRCTVVGTGAESADDWIVRRGAELADAETPYTLVTSDRALREVAGARARRTIGGGSFLAKLDW